jgi:S-DNA-T family DNA segregation ATPase FtsK/SpoIIIE
MEWKGSSGIIMENKQTELNNALEGLKLDAICVGVKQHRHFVFYDVKLGDKCRLTKLSNASKDLALKIKSKTDPIIKPLRDQGLVRLQVVSGDPVSLDLDDSYQKAQAPTSMMIPFLFGESDEGQLVWNDMAKNPHMLVAGATGSGKSVFLHNLIANASKLNSVRLFLSDPKGVEFEPYRHEGLRDLVPQITNDHSDTCDMLESLIEEMETRYQALKDAKLSSIEQEPEIFDKIILVIDEVADLMMADGKQKTFENRIIKLAQKSRAAGIYMVLATQRPSIDVLTGLIKANFEARLACKVSSRVDSQVIMDQAGAELLMGRGDAILKNGQYDYVRLQVAYTTSKQVVKNYLSRKF